MCVMSATIGALQQLYPNPQTFPVHIYPDLTAIMERLKAIDEKLGQPDCPAPEKKTWLEALEARVKALEEQSNG